MWYHGMPNVESLPSGYEIRLRDYDELAVAQAHKEGKYIVDLSQNAAMRPQLLKVVPPLLRSSCLFPSTSGGA